MYVQPDQTPALATPILGDSDTDNESNRQRNLATVTYHALLNVIAIVAGVSIMLVKTGVLNVGNKVAQDKWSEIAAQVVNGVFTWKAMTDHPVYIYRIVMLVRVLKEKMNLDSRFRAVHYLSSHFPLVFIDTSTTHGDKTVELRSQLSGGDADTYMTSKNKTVICLGNVVFLHNEANYLRNAFIILNCGCIFQYVMTGFMWGYSAASRPGFMLPVLLPPTILCSIIGERRIKVLSKKIKGRQVVIDHGGELAIKRESMALP
ncbi:hypothetical protein ON010_g950 [Phytophthora cinnamomi]|nr:hypothetical protein ON010_g950 [Phytophthora cinnamomi]